jgi:hypothetical protein
MAEQPWFKFYAADYLLDPDVDALPRQAEALLVRMWCVCHREGSCPADADTLARKTLCSVEYVLQCKSQCEPLFELRQDGKLYSRRMEEEKLRSEQARKNANKRYAQTNPKSKSKSESKSESESERGTADCTANRTANCTAAHKPTLNEVRAYCEERKNHVDPQKWFDHYCSNGWKVGRNPMKDWKAAVRTWEQERTNGNGNRAEQRQAHNLAAAAEAKRAFGLVD